MKRFPLAATILAVWAYLLGLVAALGGDVLSESIRWTCWGLSVPLCAVAVSLLLVHEYRAGEVSHDPQ